jgi:flagellar hook assembly protein FlgD
VRTLVSGMQQAGELRVTWDGRTQTGTRVGRGVYVYRLEAGGTSRTGKMLVE